MILSSAYSLSWLITISRGFLISKIISPGSTKARRRRTSIPVRFTTNGAPIPPSPSPLSNKMNHEGMEQTKRQTDSYQINKYRNKKNLADQSWLELYLILKTSTSTK